MKKYLNLCDEELPNVDKPKKYNSTKSKINGYRNMVYKMIRDGIEPVIIKEYVKHKGFLGTDYSIEHLIVNITANNFKRKLHRKSFENDVEVPGLITIKRNDLLKYICTKNNKIIKDSTIQKYIKLIKIKYPIINEIINIYNEFYNIFNQKDEKLLDKFIQGYEVQQNYIINEETGVVSQVDDNIENIKSGIQGFIKSIKIDIAPIKAAISFNESSGFVEGNNNKFKLIKRILYGRCNLVNLFKKCFSIFSLKTTKNIFQLLNFISPIPYQA